MSPSENIAGPTVAPTIELTPERRSDVEALVRAGLDEALVASALRIPLQTVKAVATFRTAHELVPEDRELADEARSLAHLALREAQWTMTFGSTDEKFRMTHLIVSRVMALIGAETTSRMDEIRAAFNELTESIRGSEDILEPASDEPEIAPWSTASSNASEAYNSDEGFED